MNNDIGGFATFDNINNKLIDDLKVQLREGCRLQIAAASFSIYAFEALKEELEQVKELQFIFTSPTFNSSETGKKEKREFFIPKLTLVSALLFNIHRKPLHENVQTGFAERYTSSRLSQKAE